MYQLYLISGDVEFLLGRFSSLKEAESVARSSWSAFQYRIYLCMCGVKRIVKEVNGGAANE